MFWNRFFNSRKIPTEFDHTYLESTRQHLRFNVMPEKMVEENLAFREYRVAPSYVEGHFDREYKSAMARSPSHLIFLSALIHWQKLSYVYYAHYHAGGYDPHGPELLKVWPMKIKISMPALLREEKGLVQRAWATKVRKVRPRLFVVDGFCEVGPIRLSGKTAIILSETRSREEA